jgi:hypothetical protein
VIEFGILDCMKVVEGYMKVWVAMKIQDYKMVAEG